jgi:hypothetical protein
MSTEVSSRNPAPQVSAGRPKTYTFRHAYQLTFSPDDEAATFGRLVSEKPALLDILIRAARGELQESPHHALAPLVGPVSTYRFRDGRKGPVRLQDIGSGTLEVVAVDPELESQEALDLALHVVTRAMPQQQERAA